MHAYRSHCLLALGQVSTPASLSLSFPLGPLHSSCRMAGLPGPHSLIPGSLGRDRCSDGCLAHRFCLPVCVAMRRNLERRGCGPSGAGRPPDRGDFGGAWLHISSLWEDLGPGRLGLAPSDPGAAPSISGPQLPEVPWRLNETACWEMGPETELLKLEQRRAMGPWWGVQKRGGRGLGCDHGLMTGVH